jgi:type VI secretion system protein ImpF
MPQPAPFQQLRPSVLDRLIDDTGSAREPHESPAWSVDRAKAAVKRDLEWLLNSRQVVANLPEDPGQLARSVLTYGQRELVSLGLNDPAEQARLRRDLVEAIARFEPRLTRVQVTLASVSALDRSIRFRIDALLRVEPAPEPVSFDSVFRLDNRVFVIEGESA